MLVIQSSPQTGLAAGARTAIGIGVPPGYGQTGGAQFPPIISSVMDTGIVANACLTCDAGWNGSTINCTIQNVGTATSGTYIVCLMIPSVPGGQAVAI